MAQPRVADRAGDSPLERNPYGDTARRLGAGIVVFESYLADQKVFRALLSKVRDTGPDVLVFVHENVDRSVILRIVLDVRGTRRRSIGRARSDSENTENREQLIPP
jgi:hypothetical protein